jgi:hypothetical protein
LFLYENVLPGFVIKTGKTLPELNDEDDIVTISYITAKVAAMLQKIKKTYNSPKKYAEKLLKQLEHKKNIASAFIMFDFNNMDTNRLYKPSEIKNGINKYMQTDIPDDDITDLAATALAKQSKAGSHEYVTSKDISKALKMLENEIELIKGTTKEEVKSIKGKQKIEFLGKPYFYNGFPPLPFKKNNVQSKSSRACIQKFIKLDLFPHLRFVYEAFFYALRDYVRKEQVYDLAKIDIIGIDKLDAKIDKTSWDSYRNLLLSLSEDQLKIIANKLVEFTTHYPAVFRSILLAALSKSL